VNVFALEVRPKSPSELTVGDIIGYESKAFNMTVVHRIINISTDEQGWYAITKGDTNPSPDPERVRFERITGVLIGLIY
jgi:signal peptidase I